MKHKSAFTFIELSILIAVISVIFTFSVVIKDRLDDINKNEATEDKILKIREAIAAYYNINGAIPCPARLDYDLYNSNYGSAVATDGNGCVTSDGVFGFGDDGNGDGVSDLFVGAVPVAELGLDIQYSLDSWGNKISYIVSSLVRNIYNDSGDFPLNNNLACWLDFSDGKNLTLREDSDLYYITNVADKSTGGNCAASQSDTTLQPIIKVDNTASTTLIGAYFDGLDDYLQIDHTTIHDLFESSHTLFFAANFDHNASTHRGLLSYANNSDTNSKELYYTDSSSGNLSFKRLHGSSTAYVIGALSETEPEIFSVTRSGSYILNPYVSYVDQGSISVGGSLATNINKVTLGKDLYDSTASFLLSEEIFEFIAYDTTLTDAQIAAVLEHLYAKWNTNKVKQNRIIIKDTEEVTRTNASVALISHGSNGYGAFNSAGQQIDFSALTLQEPEYYNIPQSTGMDAEIYTDLLGVSHNLGEGWLKGFDDIVRYYNIFELRTVAGR